MYRFFVLWFNLLLIGSTYMWKCPIWCWVFFHPTFIQPYRGLPLTFTFSINLPFFFCFFYLFPSLFSQSLIVSEDEIRKQEARVRTARKRLEEELDNMREEEGESSGEDNDDADDEDFKEKWIDWRFVDTLTVHSHLNIFSSLFATITIASLIVSSSISNIHVSFIASLIFTSFLDFSGFN